MRRIHKRQEPLSFTEWKALRNDDWAPTYPLLQSPQKTELHRVLLQEQGFTCCYCGREIDLADSHIEHFRPQSKYESLELDYSNLFASCIRELRPGSPIVCGHRKDEQFEETFLSPLETSIENRFSYTLPGEVLPRDDAAKTMVDILGLNTQFLSSRRSAALMAVFDPAFITAVTKPELDEIAISFRTFGADGRLSAFFHSVARFAEDLR